MTKEYSYNGKKQKEKLETYFVESVGIWELVKSFIGALWKK